MIKKNISTRQKAKRTLLGAKTSEGSLGKRPVKDFRIKEKQKRGDRRTHPTHP